jgi:repressor LexA
MEERLTEAQARVLGAVRKHADTGTPPSYRTLCAEFGWRSTGTVRDHLQALARKGLVELPKTRGGRVTLVRANRPATPLPVLGSITAGKPTEPFEAAEDCLPVPSTWLGQGEHFCLRVRGDSMKDAGILPGDVVVIRSQADAKSGQIVAVTVNGETTLKRLVKGAGKVRLVAANPDYPPIELATGSLVIHGPVVGLLRDYSTK